MAFDLEPLPPAVLQALAADVPRAFVEQLVRCAADDLVREHVTLSRAPGAETLVTEWRGACHASSLVARQPSVFDDMEPDAKCCPSVL